MLYLLSFLSILTLQEPEGSWWGGQEEGKKERGGQTAKEETLLLTEQEGPLNVEAVWAQVGTEFPDTEHFRRERIYGGQSAEVGRVAAKLADPLPDRPGRADPFHGLGANFYSLKIIFLWGRLALGHWSVAFGAHLSWHGDRSWLVRARLAHDKQAGSRQTGWLTTNRMAHDHGCHRAWLVLEILPCDLSMGLHIKLDKRLVFGNQSVDGLFNT